LQRGLAERQAFDAVVAGLVLNFVSYPEAAVRDMATACRPGGTVAVYVWDYLDGMEIIRLFWEQAFRSDRSITRLPEVRRYPLCRPAPLRANFTRAELEGIEVRPLDAPARFRDFDDYWQPFLGGQGTAPTYLATLRDEQRNQLRERLRRSLPTAADGSISLHVRAWAVRGTVRA
jgi:SAM-dependent methyltransferase